MNTLGYLNDLEKNIFNQLQNTFTREYKAMFDDNMAKKTIVIVPGLTLDREILSKIDGFVHYEERLLCLLLLLRMPHTNIIYITSTPIDPIIIDYYLHLLSGITGYHARQRLHFFSCHDSSSSSLTEKILARPRLIERIKKAIPSDHKAHLSFFNVTELEKKLAVILGLPLYGCDSDLLFWGTKSGSREIFKSCGVAVPLGFENLKTENDIINALTSLYKQNLHLKKAVVKMNDGFSGEGNAIFSFKEIARNKDIKDQIRNKIKINLDIVAENLSYEDFIEKFESMGGIVETFLDGIVKKTPSVQCRINPLGKIEIISTHDQVMGGNDEQVFLGGIFPADNEYAIEIANISLPIAEEMMKKGVQGRFGIDFMSVKENNSWKHYAIEINLRKGGTTHPFIMLQFLTDGTYNASNGKFILPNGDDKYYFFTDNLKNDQIKGLTPEDLMEIAICNELHYDYTKEEGVMFHLIGALSQYGKLGLVCIGSTPIRAKYFYDKTIEVLLEQTNEPV